MFADDIKLYRISWSPEDCLQLQRDIDVLVQWSKTWLFSFIVNKCKGLHIGNTVIQCNHQYTLQDVELKLLEGMRDLGVHTDSKLKLHVHTDIMINKAKRTLASCTQILSARILTSYSNCINP